MSYSALEIEIIRWAEARSIIPRSTPKAQAFKTLEEVGELLEAATGMQALADVGNEAMANAWKHHYKDALGDVLVTLIIGAALADVDLVQCLELAYDEIKDRKGTLSADGIFVKAST